jgi:hypothetical protein
MFRCLIGLLILAVTPSRISSPTSPATRSVCDLSRDLSAYRDKLVAVRGIYFYGLRQVCPEKCATGPWPSFLDLVGTGHESWDEIAKAQQIAELEGKKGNRVEVWVTVIGKLRTVARRTRLGPCDKVGSHYFGYGHLGGFPAQLEVEHFSDIAVTANCASPYDYSNIYSGPL